MFNFISFIFSFFICLDALWIFFIVVCIWVKNGVPYCHIARIISNVFGVMPVMICCTCPKWNQAKGAPWKFITAVSVQTLLNSHQTPDNKSPVVHLAAKHAGPKHSSTQIKEKLYWMNILSCHRYRVHMLMMLLVYHLVQWQILWLCVEKSMNKIEGKVFKHKTNNYLPQHFKLRWKSINFNVPRKLIIIQMKQYEGEK